VLEELSSNVADEEEDEGNETGGGDAEYGGGKLVLSLEPATNPKITVSTGENDSNSNEGLCSKTVDPFVRYYKKIKLFLQLKQHSSLASAKITRR
jgi:hypothetical protein